MGSKKIIFIGLVFVLLVLVMLLTIWKPKLESLNKAIETAIAKCRSEPSASLIVEIKQDGRWINISRCVVDGEFSEDSIERKVKSDMEIKYTLIFNKGYRY